MSRLRFMNGSNQNFPAMGSSHAPIKIVCGTCSSTQVSRDAWADSDESTQQWVLGSVFDYGHCHDCDAEAQLSEVPLANG